MGQKPLRRILVFISSPRDVVEERGIAVTAIRRLNLDRAYSARCILVPVDWTDAGAGTAWLATLTPQEAIARNLTQPADCHIVVVILWSLLGTPLDDAKFRRPDGSPYLSGTEYEYETAVERARSSRDHIPRVLVYRRMADPVMKANDPDAFEKVRQYTLVENFFRRFTDERGIWKESFDKYDQPADFGKKFDVVLRKQVDEFLAHEPPAGETEAFSAPVWEGSPFPGLRAFTPKDAVIFFGRERETDQLLNLVGRESNRFVAVFGASGSGKSSLVGAGLLPRLAQNAVTGSKDWQWIRFTPGNTTGNPFHSLASACLAAGFEIAAPGPPSAPDLCTLALRGRPEWAELLLVIDQLEEVFTAVRPEFRSAFLDWIASAAKVPRLRIIVTARSDFYDSCVAHPEIAELLHGATYSLSSPRPSALYDMITRPAAYADIEFDPELPDRILADTGTGAGALALLGYLLDELYRESRRSGSRALTHAAYEALGRVQGALARRADACFASMSAAAQDVTPAVLQELIHVDERGIVTKHRAPLAAFANDPAASEAIEALIDSRLVFTDGSGGATVEVAHEAFLQAWPRLNEWIAATLEDRRLLARMRVAAQEWESRGHNPRYLWTHDRSRELQAMLLRLRPRLSPVETSFSRPESEHLIGELNDAALSHDRRAQIGDRLDEIGDSRPGVGVRADGAPDFAWCPVRIAASPPWARAQARPDFFISRYPVTLAQFRAFVTAPDGFRNRDWWHGLDASDRQRRETGRQKREAANHPADNVSWYDAITACRWMSARLGYLVRLPSSEEWQIAATNNLVERAYPWGSKWHPACANTAASYLQRTTAVGMYPLGAASNGALDLAGNILEWTDTPAADPRRRVARGGSWYHSPSDALARSHIDVFAYERLDYCGFRVVCLHPPEGL